MNAPGIVCNGAALYDFQKGEYLETILLDESTAGGDRRLWTDSPRWRWRHTTSTT